MKATRPSTHLPDHRGACPRRAGNRRRRSHERAKDAQIILFHQAHPRLSPLCLVHITPAKTTQLLLHRGFIEPHPGSFRIRTATDAQRPIESEPRRVRRSSAFRPNAFRTRPSRLLLLAPPPLLQRYPDAFTLSLPHPRLLCRLFCPLSLPCLLPTTSLSRRPPTATPPPGATHPS